MRPVTGLRSAGSRLAVLLVSIAMATASGGLPLPARAATAPVAPPWSAQADPSIVDGENSDCGFWKIIFLTLGFFDLDIEVAEEGWVWVNGTATTNKFREAAGVVTKSKIAHNDTPSNHYSHDWNVDIRVDSEYKGVLSNVNGPNSEDAVTEDELVPPTKIEMEWETGITPGVTSGDGNPFLPRWVLPNLGDRVWTNGHWVFDCGHAKPVGEEWVEIPDPSSPGSTIRVLAGAEDHFRTEIHPGRAIASMRTQSQTLPGSGTTPVPVTATDLYIHGQGGFMVQQLECGIGIILSGDGCDVTSTPIDDLYSFEVCLPPKPVPWATLAVSNIPGPDDDGFGPIPQVVGKVAASGCLLPTDEYGNDFDDGEMLEVTVDLRGSGIGSDDVYSRKIVAGWVYPPSAPLAHLSLELDRLDLEEDHEVDLPGVDAEMTFWWMGVDRAPSDEWYRLVNFEIPTTSDSEFCFEHTNHLNDMDDDDSCGDGLLNFSGPAWDFYLGEGQPVTVHTSGFEQDCYDYFFGSGEFSLLEYVACHVGTVFEGTNDYGNNDALPPLDHAFVDPLALEWPQTIGDPDEFEFDFSLTEIPLADEDTADLSVSKTCSFQGEVALAGEPFTCSIVVSNAGPGLPRNVVLTDTLSTSVSPTDYSVGAATFRVGSSLTSNPCSASSATGFSCAIGTVPVGGSVTIDVQVLPSKPGLFVNSAAVATDSADDVPANDEASAQVDVYLPVPVDVSPGSASNPVNLSKKGLLTVAILTGTGFDATTLDVATACFGDSGNPAERNCVEAHGGAHVVDADKDKDKDLVFHFEVLGTGIDLGDTTACLRGTTTDGIGFYGCDVVTPF